jgi:hypothetical protein
MKSQNLTFTFTVDQTPDEAFAAINNVRAWWSGDIEGDTCKLGSEWSYRYKDIHYSKQRITELVPGKKVAWLVVDSFLNFVDDKKEWNGTEITFDIAQFDIAQKGGQTGGQTEVRFTHQGLTPEVECFDGCSSAWGFIINTSLRNLIATGKGQPFETEKKSDREMVSQG